MGKPSDTPDGQGQSASISAALTVTGAQLTLTDLVPADVLQKCHEAGDVDGEGLDKWFQFLQTKFEQFITLLVDPGSGTMTVTELGNALAATILPKVEGSVLMVYDTKTAGEAASHPAVRLPPFRAQHCKRNIQAFVRGRGKDAAEGDEMLEELLLSDMICVLDGGRSGNDSAMQACFVKADGSYMQKQNMSYMLISDEESFCQRRDRMKGFIQQAEGLHLFTRGAVPFLKKARKHFDGTNKGSAIGPIKVLPWTDGACWRLPADDKKRIFGKEHIVLVGGAVPEDAGDVKVVLDDQMDPVFYHFNNPLLYSELIHSYKPAAVVRAPSVSRARCH